MTEYVDTSAAEGIIGIKRYILRSDNAENKHPDPSTKDGRDKITARLTSLESVFIDYVAKGRAVSRETILSDYGRGGILIARDALRVGMIDGILSTVIDSSIDPESQTTIDDPIEAAKKRKWLLWLILFFGVSGLSFLTYRIFRQMKDTASKQTND
jgi:ClpP class serine protease